MRIVLASSEAVPFSKTGGLADVASALSKALAESGHDVWLFAPNYPGKTAVSGVAVQQHKQPFDVVMGPKTVPATLLRATLPDSDVTVFLVDQPVYFDRPGLYQINGYDFPDNCERFIFFSRAVLEATRRLDLGPDVVHANDWQTGLLPALCQIEGARHRGLNGTASVFTIHNLAFQGNFWRWNMWLTGLDWKYFNWQQMEYYGNVSLLKTGVVFADRVTTVSPTYAREIQTPEFGCGMETVLRTHEDKLVGIMNGIDTSLWNPATDKHLAKNYSSETVQQGKAACKADIQKQMGLPVRPEIPLIVTVSRLTDQKGFDLICERIDELLERDIQLIVLGTGDKRYESRFRQLTEQFPQQVGAYIGFDEALAHRIEAGGDMYLMPSRFEPGGLNQQYSLAYGTIPIVRSTGGLADSVVDATPENLKAGTANGFCFRTYESRNLYEQIHRALNLYEDKQTWSQLIRTGMAHDWSWSRSAAEYHQVYRQAIQARRREETED